MKIYYGRINALCTNKIGGFIVEVFLTVIIAISSLVLIGTVVVTESAQAGLGTLQGEQSNLWGEHRGTSKKEIENRIITVSSVVFLISVIALAAI